MHYSEYFSMRHYAGFSQIGSHIMTDAVYDNEIFILTFYDVNLYSQCNVVVLIMGLVLV